MVGSLISWLSRNKMKVVCYIEREREWKTTSFMKAFARGANTRDTALAVTPDSVSRDANVHVLWGHRWFSQQALPEILKREDQHYIVIDNGWFYPANGTQRGYFRVMIDGMLPKNVGIKESRSEKVGVYLEPWRKQRGEHVLICMPGPHFGLPWGINVLDWEMEIVDRVQQHTDRPIIVRRKGATVPLETELQKAHCLVTHSSASAVQAALRGVPVFCEQTCSAVEVGCTDLSKIEEPVFPDRRQWLDNLLYQQWNLSEYNSGEAWRHIRELLK